MMIDPEQEQELSDMINDLIERKFSGIALDISNMKKSLRSVLISTKKKKKKSAQPNLIFGDR